jgi:ABC-type branched-subunit amino acid transport system substrate-binding protein/predicted negative regulator of RcsB-dependent stress response
MMVGFMVAAVCAACAPRTRPVAFPQTGAAADQLFQQAEKKYQTSAFPEAMVLYQEYLDRYADHPLAPAALLRIGSMYSAQGDAAQARRAYERLVSDYPSSALRSEAELEILSSLTTEGRHQEVIARGGDALARFNLPAQRARAFSLIGDAHLALGSPLKAVEAYTRALKLASPSAQQALVPKLRSAVLKLSPEEVRALAESSEADLPMDYLLFQSGMLLAREGRTQEGLVLLKSFQRRYPGHEYSERTERAIAELLQAPSLERRVLGCLLPLSGAYQAIGQRALRGIELAVALHNSTEKAVPVRMVMKDTASDLDRTLQALRELEQEQASAVIGPMVHADTAAREAQQLGVPMIAITQKESVVGIGDYVFRNFITPRAQMRSLATYAAGKLGVTQAVVLFPDETYGHAFAGLFNEEFRARGGEVLAAVPYSPGATDFAAPIKKLLRFSREVPKEPRSNRPDPGPRRTGMDEKDVELVFDFQAVFIPDEPKKAGMLAPQLAYHDIRNIYLLGTNLWHSPDLLKYADAYVQGAIMPDAFFDGSPEPAARRFVSAFEAAYQEKPGFIEAIAYDSANILFDVVGRPGVRFRSDVASALRSPEGFPGATGFTRFEQNGDVDKALHILEVRGRKFVELE